MKYFALLTLITTSCWAQSSAEQAVILNQELQFLEDSARSVTSAPRKSEVSSGPARSLPESTDSLERTYFNDGETDAVRTRAAAPRRRAD